MRKIYIIIWIVFGGQTLLAQTGWEAVPLEEFSEAIMSIEQTIPENSAYSYETEYKFYEELEGEIPVLTDKATLICNDKNEIYMVQFGKMIAQNQHINLICDTTTKTITITNAVLDFTKRKSFSDFSVLQKSGSVIQRKTEHGKIRYYIQFPKGFQYAGAELALGGALGVEKYILYSKETKFENMAGHEVISQPRMEITYKNFAADKEVDYRSMKKITDFMILNGEEYVLTTDYSGYELIDLR